MQLQNFATDIISLASLRENTKSDYRSVLRCHVFPQYGHFEIQDISKNDIQEILRNLNPPIAAKTLAVMKTVFREAQDYGYLVMSPAIGVKSKSLHRVPRKFLKWEVVRDTNFGTYDTQIKFLAAHGLRWSEALALTSDDFRDGRISVTKSIHGESKSKSSVRVVPQLTDFKKFPRSPKTLKRVLDPHGVCIHSLRHSYAYLLKQQGVHVTTAQRLLGHSDSRMTLNVYTQVLDEEIDNVGSLLRSRMSKLKAETRPPR